MEVLQSAIKRLIFVKQSSAFGYNDELADDSIPFAITAVTFNLRYLLLNSGLFGAYLLVSKMQIRGRSKA